MAKIFEQKMKTVKNYSINYIWLGCKVGMNNQIYITLAKNEEELYNQLEPVFKHAKVNKSADVNIWYNPLLHSEESIYNTEKVIDKYAEQEELKNIHLKNLFDIAFYKENQQMLTEAPLYFRIDYSKLIILLHCLESEGKDAAIFNDFTVGFVDPKNPKIMNKDQYFDAESMIKLREYGILLNLCDYNQNPERPNYAAENQFIEMINEEYTVKILKYIVDLNLIRASTIFDMPEEQQKILTPTMFYMPYLSTIQDFPNLYKGLKDNSIMIKAEIVNEGEGWVVYNPEKYGLKFLGTNMEKQGYNYGITENGQINKYNRDEIVEGLGEKFPFYHITRLTFTRPGNTHLEKSISCIFKNTPKFWDKCADQSNNDYTFEEKENDLWLTNHDVDQLTTTFNCHAFEEKESDVSAIGDSSF